METQFAFVNLGINNLDLLLLKKRLQAIVRRPLHYLGKNTRRLNAALKSSQQDRPVCCRAKPGPAALVWFIWFKLPFDMDTPTITPQILSPIEELSVVPSRDSFVVHTITLHSQGHDSPQASHWGRDTPSNSHVVGPADGVLEQFEGVFQV